jgi:hypothetical protein
MPVLIDQQKKISTFAVHADVGSFIHRVTETDTDDGTRMMAVEYFQFARTADERKFHTLSMLHSYVMILDVFADFLVEEQKAVPQAWKTHLHTLGADLERRAGELKDKVVALQAARDAEKKPG